MRTILPIAAGLLTIIASLASGQEKFDPSSRAAKIAPLVADNDVLIMHADLRRCDPGIIWAEVATWGPIGKVESLKALVESLKSMRQKLLAAKVHDVYAIGLPGGMAEWKLPAYFVAAVEPGGDQKAVLKLFRELGVGVAATHEHLVAWVPKEFGEGLEPPQSMPVAQLETAFRIAGDTDFQALFFNLKEPSSEAHLREFPFFAPPWIKLQDQQDKFKTLIFTARMQPTIATAWIAMTVDGVSAAQADESISEFVWPLPAASLSPEFIEQTLMRPVQKASELRTVLTEGNGGVSAMRKALAQAYGDPIAKQRQLATRNNIMEMGLGIHNYEDVKRKRISDLTKDGKPLLSWRVQILPYVNQATLYSQFHLDEAWDSDHNRKLIPQIPRIFTPPGASAEMIAAGKTNYLAFTGEGTALASPKPLPQGIGQEPAETQIWMFEADEDRAVVWSKPEDFGFNERDALAGMKEMKHGGIFAGATNGYPFFLAKDKVTTEAVLKVVLGK